MNAIEAAKLAVTTEGAKAFELYRNLLSDKAKQQVTACRVVLSGERVDTVPRVFKKIHLHFEVTGFNVSEKHVERAVNLSAEKYCSVSIMLSQSVKVTHSFSIKQAD